MYRGECYLNGSYFHDVAIRTHYLMCVATGSTLNGGQWVRAIDGNPVICHSNSDTDPFRCDSLASPNASLSLYLPNGQALLPEREGFYKCCLPTGCLDPNTNVITANIFRWAQIAGIKFELLSDMTMLPQQYALHAIKIGRMNHTFLLAATWYYETGDTSSNLTSVCNEQEYNCTVGSGVLLHTINGTYDYSVTITWNGENNNRGILNQANSNGDHVFRFYLQFGISHENVVRNRYYTVTVPASTPSNLSVTSGTASTISLSWNALGSIDADGYVVNVTIGTSIIQTVQIEGGNSNKTTLKGLASGTIYSITIRAYQQLLGPASSAILGQTLPVVGVAVVKKSGQSISFNCTANGIPTPTIVWMKDGQLIVPNKKRSISVQLSAGFHSNNSSNISQVTSNLTISDLTGSDNGSYFCRADNNANIGTVLNTSYQLAVIESPLTNFCLSSPCVNGDCQSLSDAYYCLCSETHTGKNCQEKVTIKIKPKITEPPQTTTGELYSPVNLTCKATGSPFPLILWYKDKKLFVNRNSNPSILVFAELTLNDRGIYHCEASNIIDGRKMSANSSSVVLNITNVVQYKAEMHLSTNSYVGTNDSMENTKQLMIQSNNYLSGSNISDTSLFYIKIQLNPDELSLGTNNDSLLVVVTLVTQKGQGDKILLNGVRHVLNFIQQFALPTFVTTVERFDGCPSNFTIIPSHSGNPNLTITIVWPETNIGVLAVVDCPCGTNGTSGGGKLQATRYCGGDFTNGAVWDAPDVMRCNFSDLARTLCHLKDLPVEERINELEALTSDSSALGPTEVAASISALVSATGELEGNITLTTTFLDTVDNILVVNQEVLQKSQESSNTSSRILDAIENVVGDINITNSSEPVVIARNHFAVLVQQIDLKELNESSQVFSVNIGDFATQNISWDDLSFGSNSVSPPTGSIQLPSNLLSSLSNNLSDDSKIAYAVFVTDSLFLRRKINYWTVGSIIISANVVGIGPVKGLKSPVNLTFQLNPDINGSFPQCSFWKQSLDNGYGDWSNDGCNTSVDPKYVTCHCDHLTNFAVLLDVSLNNEPTERTELTLFLDSISYVGIMVSIVCLIITIISYLLSKKLRSSDHGQLLLNLCFALLGLYLSFIVALHSKNINIFCAFSGAVLQYFFLVTFIVMAAEAIHLYIKLVIVLGRKIENYVLKATVVSWIAPVFVVLFCFSPDYKSYISDPPNFCRAFRAPFYIGMVVPFVIIYLFNCIIFVVIMVSLLHKTHSLKLNDAKMKKDKDSKSFLKQQLIRAITLSILFGLGWGLGLLVTEDIYTSETLRDLIASVFVILTGFHGLFLLITYCLRSEEARHVWKNILFCGKDKEFSKLSLSNLNKTWKKSPNTTKISYNLATSLKKDQAEEGSQMRSYEYTKKNETGKKEVHKDEGNFDLNNPNDGQATLRFYAKKYNDNEAQFDILNDESSESEVEMDEKNCEKYHQNKHC
ncbi:PREDICTED: uncharacterized protein LOC109590854 [Amphimedon queenslandica]|nr:PREDICTED: uncharacterized protein LOC109590854 [Amphimedon queenslandica]|eukprot:XP_019862297.1 PREDICTED: uncharacterized protein LOC109590854 [Amphimedon queenslandica]